MSKENTAITPIKVGLFDGSFIGQPSATLGGDNKGDEPTFIEWVRDEYLPVTFFTDMCINKVKDAPAGVRRVVWLLEPEELREDCYISAYNIRDRFDYLLSFQIEYVLKFPNGLWCPLGGSWVSRETWWKPAEDRNLMSMITTDKSSTSGHMMRQQVHKALKSARLPVDFHGRGSNPMASKRIALSDYYYSIVVESVRSPFYFSEKLLDCFAMGTIPIYWGAPNISMFFDPDGIIPFDTMSDLRAIIRYLSSNASRDYPSRLDAAKRNRDKANDYACVEDWLYHHYNWLFHNRSGEIDNDIRPT